MSSSSFFLETMPPIEKGRVIGLFGGSFNPAHEGHVLVAKTALKRLGLDQLWWMVSPGNPLKDNSNLPSVKERLHYAKQLIQSPKIFFTGFEEKIKSFRSLDTVSYILSHNKGAYFVFIMGSDNLANFHLWYKWEEIITLIPLAIVNRPTALYASVMSPFAKKYQAFRLKEKKAKQLPFYKTPVWCYIHGNLSDQSSTKIRENYKICKK